MKDELFSKLMEFLGRLEAAKIHYTLGHFRDDSITVTIAVPGELWEVDFYNDRPVEVERFKSNGEIYGEETFIELFAKYSD